MGADIASEHGFVIATRAAGCTAPRSGSTSPSVGATENLLMAAVLAKGTTVIDNAAREPEIVDICAMLIGMGAQIDGAGTSTLVVEGVDELLAGRRTATVPDRIVAGTWAFAAAMTRGDVIVERRSAGLLEIALDKLANAGAAVDPRPTASGSRWTAARAPWTS